MNLEVIETNEYAWVREVADKVAEHMVPIGYIGPVGYMMWTPDNVNNMTPGQWQIAVYPTPNEVAGKPDQDGARYICGFTLRLLPLLAAFQTVTRVEWVCPARYTGDLDGPEIVVHGVYADHDVVLRVFSQPPKDEPASTIINHRTGEIRPKAD